LIARQIGQKQDEATASSCLMVATALGATSSGTFKKKLH